MLNKTKYLLGISATRPVFVIGTGRFGTHWLGYALGNHPEVRATVEVEPMFGLSTRMALNPTLEGKLFRRLVMAYRWQLFKSAPRLYLDKSHPNIWIAEKGEEGLSAITLCQYRAQSLCNGCQYAEAQGDLIMASALARFSGTEPVSRDYLGAGGWL